MQPPYLVGHTKTHLHILLFIMLMQVHSCHAMDVCILLETPNDSAQSKFDIDKPGNYCLTRDLHARFELAHHPAEGAIIIIWSSDVVLDLQGHTLGRGVMFKNPGGVGISIRQGKSNIKIMNGTLQDFDRGINRISSFPIPTDIDENAVYDSKANTFTFPVANVVLENLIFNNNKKNYQIRIPNKPPLPDPATERRRKSQYPPCGGTDYFGQPLAKGQPCDDGK